MKLREIRLNPTVAMEVGLWFADHAGHEIELRGDEHTHNMIYDTETVIKYAVTPLADNESLQTLRDARRQEHRHD